MAGADTVELDVTPPGVRGGTRRRFWRGLIGSLAAGWAAVTVVIVVAQLVVWFDGGQGPGTATILGHLVGTGLSLTAAHAADRLRGLPAAACGVGVGVLTGALLWLFWWN